MTKGLKEAISEDARRIVDALVNMAVFGRENDSLVSTSLGQWAAVELLREDGFVPPVVD
jgi:hypothetical protein